MVSLFGTIGLYPRFLSKTQWRGNGTNASFGVKLRYCSRQWSLASLGARAIDRMLIRLPSLPSFFCSTASRRGLSSLPLKSRGNKIVHAGIGTLAFTLAQPKNKVGGAPMNRVTPKISFSLMRHTTKFPRRCSRRRRPRPESRNGRNNESESNRSGKNSKEDEIQSPSDNMTPDNMTFALGNSFKKLFCKIEKQCLIWRSV